MRVLGIGVRQTYSQISDHRLDELVQEITTEFPSAGYRLVRSHLSTRGYRVSEQRVRLSLNRVDPSAVAVRWSMHNAIHRRAYRVAYPNAVWHIDGNMSLIRWGFVVHGAIDGYSRLITYLRCSSNNRADTVLQSFIEACERYGYPSRVRSDQGGENIDVARLMLLLRGPSRGSHITGRSVNNIRIERLWRDVFTQCLSMFYHLFYFMEDRGILNPENPVHMYALHYVYIVRINNSLAKFAEAWNAHPLRTANNRNPFQLWVRGMLDHIHESHAPIQELFDDPRAHTEVVNDESDEPYSPIVQDLERLINPSNHSTTWGVDLYVQTLQFLFS